MPITNNYLKGKKAYDIQKKKACSKITQIYHENHGRLGHRNMRIFLELQGIILSKVIVHKYMNKELAIHSIVMYKRPSYIKGHTHKIFPNLLQQNFSTTDTLKKYGVQIPIYI